MNKKRLCVLQFNMFCAQAAAAGIRTAFLSAQTQIPSSVPLLQMTVVLILGWLYLQHPQALRITVKYHEASVMEVIQAGLAERRRWSFSPKATVWYNSGSKELRLSASLSKHKLTLPFSGGCTNWPLSDGDLSS